MEESDELYESAVAKVKEYRGPDAELGQGPMAELPPGWTG